jgi:hypothetical protein
MLTATSFTPVSSCQSGYTSLIAFSSRLQGLHQVAQNEMTIGLPSLESSAVFTVFPFTSLSNTEGSSANAEGIASRAPIMSIVIFFILNYG